MTAAAGDVAEAVGEHGLADPDRAHDDDREGVLQEAQAAEFGPELTVEADLGLGIPGLHTHSGVELGHAGAVVARDAVAAGDLVAQDKFKEVLVGQLLLAGQGKALGQGLQDGAQLEAAQYLAELG